MKMGEVWRKNEKGKKVKESLQRIFLKILLIYNLLIISSLVIVALKSAINIVSAVLAFLFLPVFFFFISEVRGKKYKLRKILWWYSLSLGLVVAIVNILAISKISDLWLSVGLIPWPLYLIIERKKKEAGKNEKEAEIKLESIKIDDNKRKFLKLLAGTSLTTVLLYFINAKKTQAAFFGSGSGSGVINIRDSSGNKIDPAVNSPLDGYAIANIEEGVDNNYFGFTNKNGEWYIMKVDNINNSFTYNRGIDDYATAWSNRDTEINFKSFSETF